MSGIKLRKMKFDDQLQICKWRQKYNTYSRQYPINNFNEWYQKQLEWFFTYDKNSNHYFVSYDQETKNMLGVTALTSIDKSNLKAEIHHFIGENYIDNQKSKESIDLIKEYAFNELKLYSLYVETFNHDTLKFNFFKDYGFSHIGLWPCKNVKIIKGNYEFIDVNIQSISRV